MPMKHLLWVPALGIWFSTVSLPLPSLIWLFVYISENCFAHLYVVFKVSCIIRSCSLAVSMGGGELRVLLVCHLPKTQPP